MPEKAKSKKALKRPVPSGSSGAKKRIAQKRVPGTTGGRAKAAAEKIAARPGHISVRMYNNILGDCFLIRIPTNDREVKILIDCGALQGMPGAADSSVRSPPTSP